jgi:uncharacterized protein (DUF58 family)
MVWVITIVSFLSAAVVALLIFFIYSQKEQIRKALKERRGEGRAPVEVELELSRRTNRSFTKTLSPRTPVVMVPALSLTGAGDHTTTS